MSTDELDRLERRLEAALHGADDRPVDVPAGRAMLGARLGRQHQQVRTWSIAAVAASVLAVIVTTSVVVAGLRDDSEGLPDRTSRRDTLAVRPAGGRAGREGRAHGGRAPSRQCGSSFAPTGPASGTPVRRATVRDPPSPTTRSRSSRTDLAALL